MLGLAVVSGGGKGGHTPAGEHLGRLLMTMSSDLCLG